MGCSHGKSIGVSILFSSNENPRDLYKRHDASLSWTEISIISDALQQNKKIHKLLEYQEMTERDIRELAKAFSTMDVLKDTVIKIHKTDLYLYILEKGTVQEIVVDEHTNKETLRNIDIETIFGDTAFISTADVVPQKFNIKEGSIIHFISKETFKKVINELTFRGSIKDFPLFSILSEKELQYLDTLVTVKNICAHEIILNKGAPPSNFYIIAKGHVRLSKKVTEKIDENGPHSKPFLPSNPNTFKMQNNQKGNSVLYKYSDGSVIIGRDSFFGAESIISNIPQPMYAIAYDNVVVLEIDRDTFNSFLGEAKTKIEEIVRRQSSMLAVSRRHVSTMDNKPFELANTNYPGNIFELFARKITCSGVNDEPPSYPVCF